MMTNRSAGGYSPGIGLGEPIRTRESGRGRVIFLVVGRGLCRGVIEAQALRPETPSSKVKSTLIISLLDLDQCAVRIYGDPLNAGGSHENHRFAISIVFDEQPMTIKSIFDKTGPRCIIRGSNSKAITRYQLLPGG
jgi:hypothetical protein